MNINQQISSTVAHPNSAGGTYAPQGIVSNLNHQHSLQIKRPTNYLDGQHPTSRPSIISGPGLGVTPQSLNQNSIHVGAGIQPNVRYGGGARNVSLNGHSMVPPQLLSGGDSHPTGSTFAASNQLHTQRNGIQTGKNGGIFVTHHINQKGVVISSNGLLGNGNGGQKTPLDSSLHPQVPNSASQIVKLRQPKSERVVVVQPQILKHQNRTAAFNTIQHPNSQEEVISPLNNNNDENDRGMKKGGLSSIDEKFQTLEIGLHGPNAAGQKMKESATRRQGKTKALATSVPEQITQRAARAILLEQAQKPGQLERERPTSLVMKNQEPRSKIQPNTRISFDTSIFTSGNSDQIPKPSPNHLPQQYQTMHAHFNMNGNNSKGSEDIPKNQRSNPLLKTSKISHSAKDIMKNLKAIAHHHNESSSTATSTGSNSSMGIGGAQGKQSLFNNNHQQNLVSSNLPFIEPSRISQRASGQVYAYATNTHDGLVRAYNEDYVAVVPDLRKPSSLGGNYQSKKVSYFGLFDGHGGNVCAQYLRDNLHQIIASQDCFPLNPEQALKQGFKQAEEDFMRQNQISIKEKSGSCAIVVMLVDDTIYTANVGDSRAVLSMNNGSLTHQLTQDHKPQEDRERRRILEAGGQLYQNYQIITPSESLNPDLGPIRVLPGRLSVSRTFGDAHAKVENFGGNPKVVIATPEITSFKLIESTHDFIMVGCDGIFDRMSSEEIIREVWKPLQMSKDGPLSIPGQGTVNEVCGYSAERVIRACMINESLDNLSVILIAFKNFAKYVEKLCNNVHLQAKAVEIQKHQSTLVGTSSNAATTGQGHNNNLNNNHYQIHHHKHHSAVVNDQLNNGTFHPQHQLKGDHRGSYISSRGHQMINNGGAAPSYLEKERKVNGSLPIVKKQDIRRASMNVTHQFGENSHPASVTSNDHVSKQHANIFKK